MIDQLYRIFLKHPIICTDSRNILTDSIFFALKGENFDGNEFAIEAINKGAFTAIVDDLELKDQEHCFYVKDVLLALHKLAKYHRKQLNIPVIGITGTNGKTTTKELCGALLTKKYKTFYTQGNLNNHIGVPLSILSIDREIEIAVIEMGANHVGEIASLCEIAQPDYGLITNIGKAHLEGFGSFENIIKAKTELYQYISRQPNGIVFINADNDLLIQELPSQIKKITYGKKITDFQYQIIENNAFACLEWEHKKIQSKLIGAYNVENIMAAICIGGYFNVDLNDIIAAIEEYKPINHRSQVLQTNHNCIILDAYNANPSSMTEAISNFSRMNKENKVLILGDMFELGDYSQIEHQNIVELIMQHQFDEVILTGPEFGQTKTKSDFLKFNHVEDVINHFSEHPIRQKNILVKGSRGMKLETLIDKL